MAWTPKERSKKQMVYQYKWRINKYPVSAETAGEYIEELDRKNGKVTPNILLDSSRSEDSVMHPCFEWNDDVAAEKYRVSQARDIIGNLVCVAVSKGNEEPQKPTRAFVNVSESKKAGTFRPVHTAMKDEEMRKVVLRNALKELFEIKNKYDGLKELSRVFEAIEETKGLLEERRDET